MDKAISAADANRNFSELLRGVRKGLSYVVTSHGKPVARLSGVEDEAPTAAKARQTLLARLEQQQAKRIGRWTRDELYEDKQ
jgi:prevent-host-death family protein